MVKPGTLGTVRWQLTGNRILILVLSLCAVTIVATTFFIVVQILRIQLGNSSEYQSSETVEAKSQVLPHEPPAAPFTHVYELRSMTISLANRNQTLAAYAEFDLVLDCPTPSSLRWMEINRASIRDAVYEATVLFTVEDFSTPEGFARIKKAIVSGLKERFGENSPRDAAIRDWVIR